MTYHISENRMKSFFKFQYIVEECISKKNKKELLTHFPQSVQLFKERISPKVIVANGQDAFETTLDLSKPTLYMTSSNQFISFCKHLRNAMAHNTLEESSKYYKSDKYYKVEDKDIRKRKGSGRTAYGFIKKDELEAFVNQIIEEYEKN